ncbi:MAG: hypothetical protein AAF721_04695 [Myxococcota bacterium]
MDRAGLARGSRWLGCLAFASCGQASQPAAPVSSQRPASDAAVEAEPAEAKPDAATTPPRPATAEPTAQCDRARWAEISGSLHARDLEGKAHGLAEALRACGPLPLEIALYANLMAVAKPSAEFLTAQVEVDQAVWARWYARSFQDCLPRECHARYVLNRYLDDEAFTEKHLSFFGYAIIAWLIDRGLSADEIRPVANTLFEVEAVTLLPPPPQLPP